MGDKRVQNSNTKVSFYTTIIAFVSVQDSDHSGAVGLFVGLSYELCMGFLYYISKIQGIVGQV